MVDHQSISLLEVSKATVIGKWFRCHHQNEIINDQLVRYVRFNKQSMGEHSRKEFKGRGPLRIRISTQGTDELVDTVVVWFRDYDNDGVFDIALKFPDEASAFKMRAIEQVCLIESYQQHMLLKEGRELSEQEAALEWISKFSKDYK